ncbi:N-acetylneuraminate synthase [Vibrio diabolicus]|uniref:N-acetylneuraminate synthase n=1 Tax=Vibrio diabolicus TaxID=50719 RepID=UPI00215CD4B7|nr:N-acetylneuraminate synthase [Vibrio diabolicus]MCR9304430.1 N-acetylneuraminate synthase [Vibrio diabolicus]MCR9425733.1 N-acetylneuraminate synthase [Vibrio diabolicus]
MTVIIAEAGVNHNGSRELAFKLIDAAKDAGADIVKFQTFKAKNLASKVAHQAEYQVENTKREESQLAMLKRLELPYDLHHELIDYCEEIGIEFLSTAFDSESLDFLVNDLGLKTLKLPSGEITNAPLILEHAKTGCDIILSTGMATLAEVEDALSVIAFGLTQDKNAKPSITAFREAYASSEGQIALQEKVTILHCTTEYPAPMDEINLRAMDTLGASFGLRAGYSDHSEGITIPIAAVARGAVLIEKHFTLDKTMEGPDHKASLEPDELKLMVDAIRNVEIALGSGVKAPTVSEIKNKSVARKSLVALDSIAVGDSFTTNNLTVKRPGTGISPFRYWDILGSVAQKTYEQDEEI